MSVTVYRKCQPDDFRCGGTTPELCLPKEKRCDGYLDCRNQKDEDKCEHIKTPCRLDQFRCNTTQRCIDQNLRCNHRNDCTDNSDEEHCSEFATLKRARSTIYLLLSLSYILTLETSYSFSRVTFLTSTTRMRNIDERLSM